MLKTEAEIMTAIRRAVPQEEFDYQVLREVLKDYASPRDKVTKLLRSGAIMRIKKGLYVFGESYRRHPYSREVLANLIYGPSYISLEYALQYYGLIPERVEAVTSVAVGRTRRFLTSLGPFTYRGISMAAFSSGMGMMDLNDGRSFLIARPEKALSDKVRCDRGALIRSMKDLQVYLFDNLRMDSASLREFSPERIKVYAERYHSRRVMFLSDLIRTIKKDKRGKFYA